LVTTHNDLKTKIHELRTNTEKLNKDYENFRQFFDIPSTNFENNKRKIKFSLCQLIMLR